MKNKVLLILLVIFFFGLTNCYSQDASLKYSEGLAAFKTTDKSKKTLYGYVNPNGKVIIAPQFDSVYCSFKNNLSSVSKNWKAGVISKKGKVIVPFEYNSIGDMGMSLIPVESFAGLWGFYTNEGEVICKPLFQNFRFVGKHRILIQKDTKWGMINYKGDLLVNPEYRWIEQINEKTFKLYYSNRWTVRDASNQVSVDVNYDSLAYSGQGMLRFSVIGKYGLINLQGKTIAEPQYDEIGQFKNSLVKVRKEKFGVIDNKNNTIIPFDFDDVIIDSLFIRVKIIDHKSVHDNKEKWGLFDLKGKCLIPPRYAKMNPCEEGLIAVMKEDGTWGFVNPKGENVIIFRYASAGDFHKGMAKVNVPYYLLHNSHPAIINKHGDYIISPAEYENYTKGLTKIDSKGNAFSIVPKNKYSWIAKVNDQYYKVESKGKFGIIDADGKEVLFPSFDFISNPSESGLFVVQKDGKYGVIDSKGRYTYKLSNRFERIDGFKEGFSKVLLKGKFGMIDKLGDVYISAQYSEMGEIHDSMVSVVLRDKWGFVDYKENLKVQPYYEAVKPFKNGVAIVKEKGKWNMVTKQGKLLHHSDFDKIEETFFGNYLLIIGDKVGLADSKGRELLAPRYENIQELENGYFLVKKNGLLGVLDKSENFVIPIEFETITFDSKFKFFITGVSGKQQDIVVK